MKLYFLRHGPAGQHGEWQGDDRKRPLTSKGKEHIELAAATLAKWNLDLDLIVSSPLTRAYQTAETVAGQLGMLGKLVTDERLAPGFGPDDLAEILREHATAKGLMLVGHEPDFSQTIGYLIGGAQIGLKKGGLAYVDLPDPSNLKGELVWLLPPELVAKKG
jgi:phosphohistidine phosphatase